MTVTAASSPAPRVTWRAGADRTSHASVGHSPRTLCGELVIPERNAWPQLRRCLGCRALVDEQMPEGESRAMWGNR